MRHRNVNIAILAFFQLLIFVTPFTIKAGHHHESDRASSAQVLSGKTISKDARCLICKFEFVTFNIPQHSAYFCFQRAYAVVFSISDEKVFRTLLTYFSRRAPPQF